MRIIPFWLILLLCGCLVPDPVPVDPVAPPVPVVDDAKPSALKVLIRYEATTADFQRLPTSQVAQLQGPQLRKWFSANGVEWRIWDKDTDTKYAPKFWQDAAKLPAPELPYIWATGGKTGFKGPLPLTGDETIKLLEGLK